MLDFFFNQIKYFLFFQVVNLPCISFTLVFVCVQTQQGMELALRSLLLSEQPDP